MSKAQVNFSFNRYLDMIADANEVKTVSAVLVLAMSQYARKGLTDHAYATIVCECGARLHAIN